MIPWSVRRCYPTSYTRSLIFIVIVATYGFPEQGNRNFTLNSKEANIGTLLITMFNRTSIFVTVPCDVEGNSTFIVSWNLSLYSCINDDRPETQIAKMSAYSATVRCVDGFLEVPKSDTVIELITTTAAATTATTIATTTPTDTKGGKKRQVSENKDKSGGAPEKAGTTDAVKVTGNKTQRQDEITHSWTNGWYSFSTFIKAVQPQQNINFSVSVHVKDSRGGFLSGRDFPFLYFYLVEMVVYIIYGFIWLFMLACNWRDLLRIQYFIGVLIIIGLIEKVFHYAEYRHVDKEGIPNATFSIVAELVSAVKRTLSRALVILVSVGFGLVKPRLGPTLHRLLAVCFIYFILASINGCIKLTQHGGDKADLISSGALALCETGIVYWMFRSLMETMKTLRLRRNVVKLALYRHFSSLMIFAVIASLAFMAWSLKEKFEECVVDFRELWLEEGFWNILFTAMLLVIMILWRPSANNSRFAHSQLVDAADEEEEETLMTNDAYDTKKRTQLNGSTKKPTKSREEKVEEDLQWIEDNIPASAADVARPVLQDSEEELMTTRFELSKMD